MTVAELAQRYADDRAAVAGATTREATPGVCRYCGRFWRPWVATKHATLDGHARCIVSREFRADLRGLYWHSPTLTIQQIADACDVSVATVNAWLGRRQR